MTSQTNVDLVLRFGPAPEMDLVQFFRDDELWATFAEAVEADFHADCEFVIRGLPVGETTYSGLDGFRALWLDWLFPWAVYRAEAQEYIDLGERVLVRYQAAGRQRGSTHEAQSSVVYVWTVRDGKIADAHLYSTREEAIEAVGLEG